MSRLTTSSALAAAFAAASAFALLAPAAHAQLDATVTFSLAPGPSGGTGVLKNSNGGGNASPLTTLPDSYIGMYTGFIDNVQVNTYCVDFTQDIGAGTVYNNYNDQESLTKVAGASDTHYYQGGLASVLPTNSSLYGASQPGTPNPIPLTAQQRADAVASIADTYLYSNDNQLTQDAVSMAIWDIVQDGEVGDVSVVLTGGESGNVNDNATVNGLANAIETLWINDLETGGLNATITNAGMTDANYLTYAAATYGATGSYSAPTDLLWVQAAQNGSALPNTQDFLTLKTTGGTNVINVPTGTPEPGIVVTSLSMMGTLGLGLVRGRRRSKAGKTIA